VEEVPWYVSLIVSWLPFIFTFVMFLWAGRRIARAVEMSLRTPDGRPVGQVLEEFVREMQRQNDLLQQRLDASARKS
jgi:hypothetical protein